MSLRINDVVPNLNLVTDQGTFTMHDFIGDQWTILFSHPKDYTPVCTTEFGAVAQLADEWTKRNTKVIGLSFFQPTCSSTVSTDSPITLVLRFVHSSAN